MKCYSYKFNERTPSTCKGSFDQCKELEECGPSEGKGEPVCFALVNLDDEYLKHLSGNASLGTGPKPRISNAGCYPDGSPGTCSNSTCLGDYRANSKQYYCCCSTSGCNGELIPKQRPPFIGTAQSTSQSKSGIPHRFKNSGSTSMINHSVIIIVVIITLTVSVLLGVYYKRFRSKRHHSSNKNRNNNHHQLEPRTPTNDCHDVNHIGPDVSIMMPFRNSFNDEGNSFRYGPQESLATRNSDNSRMNHNGNPNNGIDLYHERQERNQKFDLKDIELLEMVGSGRFGTVHRANLIKRTKKASDRNNDPNGNDDGQSGIEVSSSQDNLRRQCGKGDGDDDNHDQDHEPLITSEIAVKIIPNNEYQSWQNELNIYNSSRTRHPNILCFLGSCENPQANSNWLLVEYASNGSLHHYLKENPVSWNEFLIISLGIVRGLSHLHDADIAHRDFKSKNVLLRHNLSPCITDFGVASMLDITGGSHNEQRKKYLQVGTPRYMAPEVLECSVAFTKISFTKIDVYALSLVLWEILSRCHPLPKLRTNEFNESLMAMPFSRPLVMIEPFILPPPHQTSQPATSTPQKIASSGGDTMLTEQSFGHNNYHQHQPPHMNFNEVDVALNGGQQQQYRHNNHHHDQQQLQRESQISLLNQRKDEVPPYKVPFEDVVGPNPDISAMRQVVVSDKLRPPIRPEWRFYPIAKLCQAIVDGWEYDHDARISASCFVERIETMLQQQEEEEEEGHQQQADEEHQRRIGAGDEGNPPISGDGMSQVNALKTTEIATTTPTTTTTMTTPLIATTTT